MLKKLPQNPIFLAAAATLAGIAVSLAVTKIALLSAGYPDIPVAFALAAALPAIVGPLTTFPLTRAHWRLRQMRIELERLANTDSLTALPNRRAFFEHAARMMARPRQEANPVTAMTIDIDRFMMINQSHGHDAGDAILCHIAAAIRDDVAASGAMDWSVARMGGEEFAVLAEGLVATAVARLAERICESARRVTRSNRDDGIAATVSVGVAFRVEGMNADVLLKVADDAVAVARRSGGDRWAFAFGEVERDRDERKRMSRQPVLFIPRPATR